MKKAARRRPPPPSSDERCVECEWCRSCEDDDELITRGDNYICLRSGRRVTGKQLWARACRHFVAIR